MISLVKNLKCISRLNIHYYPNLRDKSYITFLKATFVGKSLISAGPGIDRILHFIFCDKIPKIYTQHWARKFHRKSVYVCVEGVGGGLHPPTPPA